ncbi:MAG TPA: mechanosensitive ion channel family protein [Acidimicrobiales bacterium]|nr:mechanosensitive ion channel family protein [Acidimicrobiales bacterium]
MVADPATTVTGPAVSSLLRQVPTGEVELDAVVREGLTATDWLVAGATFVGFVVAAMVLRRVVERLVRRTDPEGAIARFSARLVRNLVVLVGVLYALTALGVRIGPLVGALGVTGIAIAFAVTAILENVFASVMLKTRRPIRVGDQVWTNDRAGTVTEINFRAVVLDSFDGERVYIPSSMVMDDVIVNHTATPTRRTVLPVGVAYGTDLHRAQDVLLAAVTGVDGVIPAPAPQAWVTTFGESSIDFDVRFWTASDIATVFRVRSGVAMAIKDAFDDEGIEIPFPQRVVTMVADEPGDQT